MAWQKNYLHEITMLIYSFQHSAARVCAGEKLKYFILYVAARGCVQVVWESKLKPNARTVLNPINNEGQELLLDFLGAS